MPEEPDESERRENLDNPPAFFPIDDPESDRAVAPGELVEVTVEGVFASENNGQITRFVLVTDGDRSLPIQIGAFEAQAIAMEYEGSRPDRPLTHDLIKSIMERVDVQLDRIVIDDFWNTVYYAKLYIKKGSEEIEIDARPSDAIALAMRFDSPIFVTDAILEGAMRE